MVRSRLFSRAFIGVLVVAALSTLFPLVALAHESRDLGKYHVLVGFVDEPAIEGQPNEISIRITNKATGQPVTDAAKTLKVTAAYGKSQPRTLTLEESRTEKGLYTAQLIPTKVGSYTFTFTGSIDGQPIKNARFQSGPNTFSDVVPPKTLEFPVAVPGTTGLAQQTQAADATAQNAKLLGFGGIAAGVIGIILAIIALVSRHGSQCRNRLAERGEAHQV